MYSVNLHLHTCIYISLVYVLKTVFLRTLIQTLSKYNTYTLTGYN